MPRIEEPDLRIANVAPVGFCSGRQEERIVPTPDSEKFRLVLPEIGLKGRIERDVASVAASYTKRQAYCRRATPVTHHPRHAYIASGSIQA
jgi:hypothetical protein